MLKLLLLSFLLPLLLPRLVREVATNIAGGTLASELRFQVAALLALQEASEAYLVTLLEVLPLPSLLLSQSSVPGDKFKYWNVLSRTVCCVPSTPGG